MKYRVWLTVKLEPGLAVAGEYGCAIVFTTEKPVGPGKPKYCSVAVPGEGAPPADVAANSPAAPSPATPMSVAAPMAPKRATFPLNVRMEPSLFFGSCIGFFGSCTEDVGPDGAGRLVRDAWRRPIIGAVTVTGVVGGSETPAAGGVSA